MLRRSPPRAAQVRGYARLEEATAPLALHLAPQQALREPPHYIEACIDLWPSAWLLASQLGVDPRMLEAPPEGERPLMFRVQVELWGDCGNLRYHDLTRGAVEVQMDTVHVEIRTVAESCMWRLQLAAVEAQAALLKVPPLEVTATTPRARRMLTSCCRCRRSSCPPGSLCTHPAGSRCPRF